MTFKPLPHQPPVPPAPGEDTVNGIRFVATGERHVLPGRGVLHSATLLQDLDTKELGERLVGQVWRGQRILGVESFLTMAQLSGSQFGIVVKESDDKPTLERNGAILGFRAGESHIIAEGCTFTPATPNSSPPPRSEDEIALYGALRRGGERTCDPRFVLAEAARLGISYDRAIGLLQKWEEADGWWQEGASERSGWFTAAAPEELERRASPPPPHPPRTDGTPKS